MDTPLLGPNIWPAADFAIHAWGSLTLLNQGASHSSIGLSSRPQMAIGLILIAVLFLDSQPNIKGKQELKT